MSKARIYRPCKSAMQSGQAGSKHWCLVFPGEGERFIDPIMGWTGTTDMKTNEIKLTFNSQEEAEDYCKKNHIAYEILSPQLGKIKLKSYVSNYQ